MPFRERVRRVFHRHSSSDGNNQSHHHHRHHHHNTRPNVEYYRRGEVPPSKFRGPFDKNHQKQLAAWSFDRAMVERPRSLDLTLSPCATHGDPSPFDSDDSGDLAPDDDGPGLTPDLSDSPISADHCPNSGSQSSTVINSDSYSASMMTLLPEPAIYEIPEDPIAQLKESVRYTSPIVCARTPYAMSPRGKHLPFSPDDLTRALIAVQVCA